MKTAIALSNRFQFRLKRPALFSPSLPQTCGGEGRGEEVLNAITLKLREPASPRPFQSFARRSHRAQNGSAVMVVLILLFIMVVFVSANTVTVNWLRRQVNLVEKQEIHRLSTQTAQPATNHPASR